MTKLILSSALLLRGPNIKFCDAVKISEEIFAIHKFAKALDFFITNN